MDALKLQGSRCSNPACAKDLEAAERHAVDQELTAADDQEAIVMATIFSDDDLNASIAFAESRAGQSIALKEAAASSEFARVSRDFQARVLLDLARDFCTVHLDACGQFSYGQANSDAGRPRRK